MIRVLVSDADAESRSRIKKILEATGELAVSGEAGTWPETISLARALSPGIIVMDIAMAGQDGYQVLRRAMEQSPRRLIVLSEQAADWDPEKRHPAVEAGALMVAAKPGAGQDPGAGLLGAYVKAMAQVKVVRRTRDARCTAQAQKPGKIRPRALEIIAIGASTGGPPALQAILNHLEPGLAVPVVVVQHISQGFISGLARWLAATTPHAVALAADGQSLEPGKIYLAPDEGHLVVSADKKMFIMRDSRPVDGHVPSVTALFLSVADSFGARAAGVLLTGMGRDGARGLKALREAGALTICQDSASSVVYGMPREAAELGAAEFVLPLAAIGPALQEVLAAKGAIQA